MAREPGRCAAGLLPEIPPGRVRLRARRVHRVFTASYNGEIVHRTYTGTYTVNPDGTGSTLLTDSNGDVTHFDIFIRKDRDEVSYVETDPGVVSSGYERRR